MTDTTKTKPARATKPAASNGVTKGEDGLWRCSWGVSTPDYMTYHDNEWGRPVGDEVKILEKLCLEGFQSGLSWLTILRKRAGFRAAFSSFDPEVVAKYGEKDIERLLGDASIVRHRGKIVATINNAQALVALHADGLSLAGLVWAHEPKKSRSPRNTGEIQAQTPESTALSKELIKKGFRFVGPTTVYAAMQSLGVVNDHMARCAFKAECAEERLAFKRPGPQI
jgi:DNA-3-methyladenine glycosylase I